MNLKLLSHETKISILKTCILFYVSTDDFFMVNGQYVYDVKMIGKYHEKNFERTVLAMQKSIPLIVIDNTNIKLWEMRKYVE